MRPTTGRPPVVAALSGGVDSAVAAVQLVEQGMTVIGMTLQLQADPEGPVVPPPEAIERARAVCRQLAIPFHLLDAQDAFRTTVIDYFISEYAGGRTPNPCVRCNRFIRFGLLMERAMALGASALATGHYARVRCTDGEYELLRGSDADKDQSYFLHALTQQQLARAHFPLGGLTKDQVRSIASRQNLPVTEQDESQDVCFLVNGDYRRFLETHAPGIMEPGPIYDTSGELLGQHAGLAAYTIGQRRGLDIPGPQRLYVLAIEPERNALIVGTGDQLGRDRCWIEDVHYVSGEIRREPFRAEAQIRYRARPSRVTVTPRAGRKAQIHFDVPQRDITPGQFLVLYEGDRVLGGGAICRSQNSVL